MNHFRGALNSKSKWGGSYTNKQTERLHLQYSIRDKMQWNDVKFRKLWRYSRFTWNRKVWIYAGERVLNDRQKNFNKPMRLRKICLFWWR